MTDRSVERLRRKTFARTLRLRLMKRDARVEPSRARGVCGQREHRRGRINYGDVPAERGEAQTERACAAAEIERAFRLFRARAS
jgi:hypothetical protein